jgi:hypothetical protein
VIVYFRQLFTCIQKQPTFLGHLLVFMVMVLH